LTGNGGIDTFREKGDIVKKLALLFLASVPALWTVSCTTEDGNSAGTVYACDAHATVLEMCQEEPNDPANLKISKSTCAAVKGAWSDNAVCPAGFKKKCQDGDKSQYFYAKDDAGKDCSALVGLLISAAKAN
jgi:hypothetical protein